MLQVHSTNHLDLNGYHTTKGLDNHPLMPEIIDHQSSRNALPSTPASSSSSCNTLISPYHQPKDKDLMHHPLGITADHTLSPDSHLNDATATLRTVTNDTPDKICHHDSRSLAVPQDAGLAPDYDPLSVPHPGNSNNTDGLLQGSSHDHNSLINDPARSTPKAKSFSQIVRKQEATIEDNIDSGQTSSQAQERTAVPSFDPLLQPINSDQRPRHISTKHSPMALPPSSTSFSSYTTIPNQGSVEYLSNMGPLEIDRGADGVVLGQDPLMHSTTINNVRKTSVSDPLSDPLLRDPSTSTLVSDLSMLSSYSITGTLIGQEQDNSKHYNAQESSWSGDHPLLADFTAEPESMDDINDQYLGFSSSHPEDHPSMPRHKGHTLSLDTTQEKSSLQDGEISFLSSEANSRRRRNGPKGIEGRSWTSHTNKEKDQTENSGSEANGRRVIIHQVTMTDTLAGIALNYGIQVSILKKSNKLWTNDSIHTRKYLYIPFEECSVAHQPGVVVDETSQSIMIPQRIQPSHERTGSSYPGTPLHEAQAPSFTAAPFNDHGSGSSTQLNQTSQTQSNISNLAGSTLDYDISTPPISAIAAGMLPSFSGLSRSIPNSSISPRLGTWNEPKSTMAPPIASSTMTATVPKASNGLQARSLSPRRNTVALSSHASTSRELDTTLLSEDLPNTVVVPSAMTHESLAARFKEMELVSSEQQQRKMLTSEQELRTNPIHHRHKTTDLRQYAHLQQHQQKQYQHHSDSGRNSATSSTTGSRRTSIDLSTNEDSLSNIGGLLSRRGSSFAQNEGSPGSLGDNPVIKEESEDGEGNDQQPKDEKFIQFGYQRHIYETDEIRPRESGYGLRSSERQESDPDWIQRRQEVVTVPAGLLSFFPSSEHSKKLETPESISKLQDRMNSYHSGSLSSSSTGSGSFRAISKDRQNELANRSKGRAALRNDTFQPPTSTVSSSSSMSTATVNEGAGTSTATQTKRQSATIRVHHQPYSSRSWSLMGETLVDDLLGAVRSKIQIARRMYDFTTFRFSNFGENGNGYNKDNNDPPDLLRRANSRSIRARNQRNKENRNSGPAIELDQADTGAAIPGSMTTSVIKTTIVRRASTGVVNSLDTSEDHSSPRIRRKTSASGGSNSSHGRGASSGSNTSAGGGGNGGSTRKRSLRSSNPINHPALVALVNEMDKDKKDKERGMQGKKTTTASEAGENDVSRPSPIVDILSTSS
ncbi:hypothetical protein FBU30_009017 [Linnemannia zychae]|nr:hypothetical protein FBU30_009017 [Linnemannia zychae]